MDNLSLQHICYLVLLFFVFSVLGWCMEVLLKYIQYHRFINRGFLIGPYCPIYGSGIVFITVMVSILSGMESSVGTTFSISFIGCGILEYAVSYYLEKRFHARWWDYSTKPMNLHGRIWIGNLILFGIGGTLVIEVINPIMYSLFALIPERSLYLLTSIIILTMSADYLTSHFVMKFVKSSVESSEADNTESISKEIKLLMHNKSILYRRIADAYPDVIYRTDRINKRMREIKAEIERIQQETAYNLDRIKQDATYNFELMKVTPSQIQEEIIDKQDQLILHLKEDNADEKAIEKLQTEIQEKKQYLEERKKLYRIR
ncbi:putative ABC transporter permease [Eisenbergiella tayi]|uniref:ABC transporter permease n=1 Tax=Eisenbergiella tayi TaxID=1432052 RepID=A0A1E3ACS5_9FIRM|nr:putative ABC transporter permease [Eisenbergiella tayi]ODM06553.1 hypothetical protein BEI61_02443 [Eisenbergiella tayi]